MAEATVKIPTEDGVVDAYLVEPDDGKTHPGVLFYMDGIGVRPQLHSMAERLASHGYVVLLPNVFYRHGPAPLIEDLPDLLKPENRAKMMEVLGPIMRSLTPAAAMRDAAAYLDFLASRDSVAPGPIGVHGYCMGGALALRTASQFPDRVAAAASFHGGNLATEAEDSPHRGIPSVQAELYFGHADEDKSMPAEQIERLEAALVAAGTRHRCEVYAGATHGYTMADTAPYNEAAAERHWKELLALYDRALPAPA